MLCVMLPPCQLVFPPPPKSVVAPKFRPAYQRDAIGFRVYRLNGRFFGGGLVNKNKSNIATLVDFSEIRYEFSLAGSRRARFESSVDRICVWSPRSEHDVVAMICIRS